MVAATKFNSFVEKLAEGGIDLDAASALKIMLTNSAPNGSTHSVKSDLTEISAGNGYSAGGVLLSIASSAQTGGTYSLVVNDITNFLVASGGTIGPFRYFVLYDANTNNLICFWDYGLSITMQAGDAINLDLDTVNGLIKLGP